MAKHFTRRPKEKLPIIYGRNPVMEALEQSKNIEKILVQQGIDPRFLSGLRRSIGERIIPLQTVPRVKLDKLCRQAHQGVVAIGSIVQYMELEAVIPHLYDQGKVPFILVLEGITDVRNFGAIARSAQFFGVDAIVIPIKNSVTVTSDAVKASAGALLKIPVCRVKSLAASFEFLKSSGCSLVAADMDSEQGMDELPLADPCAIILGAEGSGISASTKKMSDNIISIPSFGDMESLNVAVAAGIILYEVSRRRN